MSCFTSDQLSKITGIVKEIEKLTDVEKLFLYLQLPCGRAESSVEFDAKSKFNGLSKSSSNLFSKKLDQETTQTYTWILSHLEVDPNVSLPKQEVYDEYKAFCQANKFEPLCVADFGKAMKHAFPCVKPRRLGQRGNSRYCYSGLRKRYKIMAPSLPNITEPTSCIETDCSQTYIHIAKECMNAPTECSLDNRLDYPCADVSRTKPDYIGQIHFNGDGSVSHCDRTELVQTSSSTQDLRTTRLNNVPNNMVPLHSIPSTTDDYFLSNSVQTLQAHAQQYNYVGMIQPGTPDDDDYQHNYRDAPITQVNKHTINSPVIMAGDLQNQHSINQFRQDDTRSLINNVISNTPVSTSNLFNNSNIVHNNYDLDANASNQLINTSANTIIHLTHLSGSHNDPCVSPFQSPASTPYPMSNNYLNQGIHDYYSTSDNNRYNSNLRSSDTLREPCEH